MMSPYLMKLGSLLHLSDLSNSWKFQIVIIYTLRNITVWNCFHFCILLGFMRLKLHQKLKIKALITLEAFKVLSWNFNWVSSTYGLDQNKMSKFIMPILINGSSINFSSLTTYIFYGKVVNTLVPFWKIEKSFSV